MDHVNAPATFDDRDAAKVKSGRSWLFWVGLTTAANALALLFKWEVSLLIGSYVPIWVAGITLGERFDGSTMTDRLPAFLAGLVMVLVYLALAEATKGRRAWPWLFGVVLYAIDLALVVIVTDWFAAALHLFALVKIWHGGIAARNLLQKEFELADRPAIEEVSEPSA